MHVFATPPCRRVVTQLLEAAKDDRDLCNEAFAAAVVGSNSVVDFLYAGTAAFDRKMNQNPNISSKKGRKIIFLVFSFFYTNFYQKFWRILIYFLGNFHKFLK